MYTDQAELEGIIKQAAKERLRLEKQLAERPVSTTTPSKHFTYTRCDLHENVKVFGFMKDWWKLNEFIYQFLWSFTKVHGLITCDKLVYLASKIFSSFKGI